MLNAQLVAIALYTEAPPAEFLDDPERGQEALAERIEDGKAMRSWAEEVAYAHGYLQGAADMLNVTISEMLEGHGLEL
jgi:hypothetical protein